MIRVRNNQGIVEIKDYLLKLYIRNGYELVEDTPKAEETVEKTVPKKPTARKTKSAKK